jgi:hypothetical protein
LLNINPLKRAINATLTHTIMAWTNSTPICAILYSLLTGKLNQIDRSVAFADAGPMTMPQLLFFNATASSDIQKQDATALASLLDNIFMNAYSGAYVSGQTQQLAITGLVNTLANGLNTVEDLSDTANGFYQFGF